MSTALTWQVTSTGSGETEKLGELFGRALTPPVFLELRADLGGGKTTFVRGLARGLGSKDVVSSPTFTLNKVYQTKKGELHHFDFYRLNEPGVVSNQLQESFRAKDAITVVEWSDIVKDVLPEQRLSIEFKPTPNDPDERQISISYPEKLAGLIRKIETDWEESRP